MEEGGLWLPRKKGPEVGQAARNTPLPATALLPFGVLLAALVSSLSLLLTTLTLQHLIVSIMAGIPQIDSANERDSLKEAQAHGESAAANKGAHQNEGTGPVKEKAEGSEGLVSSPMVKGDEVAGGGSAEQEGQGKTCNKEDEGQEHSAMVSEGKEREATSDAQGEAADAGSEPGEAPGERLNSADEDQSSSSGTDSDSGSTVPPLNEAISAAEESLSEAYLDLGFHLAETSDGKTRKVLEAAMESVMKAARQMKVVEKVGEEMMKRESEGAHEQPAESAGHTPAATLFSVPTQVRDEQQQQPLALLETLRQLLEQPRANSASLAVALPGLHGTSVTQGPIAASKGAQPRRAQSSSHPKRKAGEIELMTSKPYNDWADRSDVISPGPKTFCISASSGERPPTKPTPGSSLDQVVKEANPLFNFVKQRSLHNASEEGKSVAFMTAFAHSQKQRRATILRCVTKKGFKGKLEDGEEGRKWSTQELREHRL